MRTLRRPAATVSGVTGMTNLLEEIVFQGHPLVRALHPSTMELTKERELTQRGDCVIGVSADKAACDLRPAVKEALRTAGASVTFTLRAGGESFVFTARGSRGIRAARRCFDIRSGLSVRAFRGPPGVS